jgi:hypothetical protein
MQTIVTAKSRTETRLDECVTLLAGVIASVLNALFHDFIIVARKVEKFGSVYH